MKICSKCKKELFESSFGKNKSKKDGLAHYCKMCKNLSNNESYQRNLVEYRKKSVERNLKVRQENRIRMMQYLLQHPCTDCKESDPIVLQFDHLRDKKHHISRMLLNSFSWLSILKEIEKCEVVCSNCHIRRTAERSGNWYKKFYNKN